MMKGRKNNWETRSSLFNKYNTLWMSVWSLNISLYFPMTVSRVLTADQTPADQRELQHASQHDGDHNTSSAAARLPHVSSTIEILWTFFREFMCLNPIFCSLLWWRSTDNMENYYFIHLNYLIVENVLFLQMFFRHQFMSAFLHSMN